MQFMPSCMFLFPCLSSSTASHIKQTTNSYYLLFLLDFHRDLPSLIAHIYMQYMLSSSSVLHQQCFYAPVYCKHEHLHFWFQFYSPIFKVNATPVIILLLIFVSTQQLLNAIQQPQFTWASWENSQANYCVHCIYKCTSMQTHSQSLKDLTDWDRGSRKKKKDKVGTGKKSSGSCRI